MYREQVEELNISFRYHVEQSLPFIRVFFPVIIIIWIQSECHR